MKRDDGRSVLPASMLVEIAISALFAIQCTETESLQAGRQAALQLFFGILTILMKRLTATFSSSLQAIPKGNVLIIGDSMIR